MKTILIAHNFSEVSFAAMSYHLAHHLAKEGNRVVFVSHHPYFSEKLLIRKDEGEIIVYSWPTEKRPTSFRDVIWFSKLYFQYKPDIVIGHFVGSNITVGMSKILSFGKVRTYEYYHTLSTQILNDLSEITWKQRLFFIRKKIFYRLFCDLLICPSELAKNDLKLFHGIEKSVVILNPMVDRFSIKTNLSEESIIISFLGRLDDSKGVIDLILAFEQYKIMHKKSKIVLNIAGTGSQEDTIKKMIIKNNAIHYKGGLSYEKIDVYLNESHYAIIPSKFDNLPTVGLEAMMNQTPLLISNTTGLAHYLTDDKDCYKFEPSVESMIVLFEKVEQNFQFQKQMGIMARAKFLSAFGIEKYCEEFSKFIQDEEEL